MDGQSLTMGFIGFGNMGRGIARGLIDAGVLTGNQIIATARNTERLRKATDAIGARALTSTRELVAASDVVIVAVKPEDVPSVLEPVADSIGDSTMVISIAWGVNNAEMEAIIPRTHHISVIPNMPIAQAEGVLVVEDAHTLSDEQYSLFTALFEPVALLEVVDAAHMSIGGIVSSCAPAFTAMYVEALADAGVRFGLTRRSAYRLAAKMVQGTGAQILADGEAPARLKDDVCSPGGATIKGVASLEQHGFRGAVISAIEAVQG
ncbi:MAG: pyrroline-5-carboxylate reductase [Bifidobacterium sp.]|jgi:pyrroline-5-carboxylate reductase